MNSQFGYYPQFYVKKKSLLFPLMEKYSGTSLKGSNHGQAMILYLDLLKNNTQFKSEVDNLIAGQNWKNALDPITGAEQLIGSIFGSTNTTASDTAFYQAVAIEQKASDNTILIISGVSVVILGLAVVLIIYYKR